MPLLYILLFVCLFISSSCGPQSSCRELTGHWTNHEGQELVFAPDGSALWLTKFGSQYDTVRMRFQFDCAARPSTLDLSDFRNGPHSGKMLFGIFDWSSDSSFRFRYEVGTRAEDRPRAFEAEQTQQFTAVPQ